MSYPFRTTYRQDVDTYIEDRGFPFAVKRSDADFAILDAEFGAILSTGQTAKRDNGGDTWEVVDGFPILDNMKAEKLLALNRQWENAEAHGVVNSSAGFAIDATERANRDITGLITGMEATGEDSVTFCAADNSFHEVTLAQLKTMLLEIIKHGQVLYARKWEIRSQITEAKTIEELAAVEISFA